MSSRPSKPNYSRPSLWKRVRRKTSYAFSRPWPYAIAVLALMSVGVGWIGGGGIPCGDEENCPTMGMLRRGNVYDEAFHIYDRHGKPMADVGGARRVWVPLDSIPTRLAQAWIAVEDKRFWDHGGIDVHGVMRAVQVNLTNNGVHEGASTIPMQLVRVVWPASQEMNQWRRKFIEARLAPRLISELGHERVLELYLNGIYLADGNWGVGAAARYFFGVEPGDLEDLTLSQMATLVGMTRTPERYDPRDNPEAAIERRNVVLDLLVREGIVTAAEAAEAKEEPMETVPEPPVSYRRDYVTASVRRELGRVLPNLVAMEGLRIFTTVDPSIQKQAEKAVLEHVRAIEAGREGRYLGGDDPLQAAAIIMSSRTGEVLAVVGGRSFDETELIRPFQSRRQVGSLAKTFVLGAAFREGTPPTRMISTEPVSIDMGNGKKWTPDDHVGSTWLTPRSVLVRSSNRGAVRLGRDVGLPNLDNFARGLGVNGLPHWPSSFLGAFEATLAEMTAAYAAFENGGERVQPYLIHRVENAEGAVLWERRAEAPVRAMAASTAYLVLDAMQGVVDGGTGWRVREHYSGKAAGKTGTTNDGADVWFVGVRPGLAAGVWMGRDNPQPITRNASGGQLAAPLWGRLMAQIPSDVAGPAPEWTPPQSLERVSLRPLDGVNHDIVCWTEGNDVLVRSADLYHTPRCLENRFWWDTPVDSYGDSTWRSGERPTSSWSDVGVTWRTPDAERRPRGDDRGGTIFRDETRDSVRWDPERPERRMRPDAVRDSVAGPGSRAGGSSADSAARTDTIRVQARPTPPPVDTVTIVPDTSTKKAKNPKKSPPDTTGVGR